MVMVKDGVKKSDEITLRHNGNEGVDEAAILTTRTCLGVQRGFV